MSADIDLDFSTVVEVLLQDGIWHKVANNSFELKRPRFSSHESGERDVSLRQGEWFNFLEAEGKHTISGPLSALYGLKTSDTRHHQ